MVIRRISLPSGKASRAAIVAGALVLLLVAALLVFTDPLLNWLVKPRMIAAFAEAYPAYALHVGGMRYNVMHNIVGFDSVAIDAIDGTASGTLDALSVSGIHWIHLLRKGLLDPEDVVDAMLDVHNIIMTFPQTHYGYRCERLRASVRDSVIEADSLLLYPLTGDEEFFRGSRFRETRFRLAAPYFCATGLASNGMLEGSQYRVRTIRCRDISLDVLVNKDKPSRMDSVRPAMPAELLAAVHVPVQVDSMEIVNARLNYGERFAVEGKAACITMDSMEVRAEGIDTKAGPDAPVVLRAKAKFMKAGRMTVQMSIPLGSPDFSLQYSGTLSAMDLRALNTFIETAEQMRIKKGDLQSAAFEIHVEDGRASGSVRVVYRGLVLAAIDKKTGSEMGVADFLTSFIANTFKIHGTNVPDKSGKLRIGKVTYVRKWDDPFFRFEWFALRSGVKDVAGF